MVFIVTPENTLQPRPVELGNWVNGQWIVNKGINDGDRVLVDGFIKAHEPGMTVNPKPYSANAVQRDAAQPMSKGNSDTSTTASPSTTAQQ
jgi:membrane fusion protein, multidrug efflux system